ncbi:CBL-interacting serine/threonine-protein kinase 23 [Asimina triloba]
MCRAGDMVRTTDPMIQGGAKNEDVGFMVAAADVLWQGYGKGHRAPMQITRFSGGLDVGWCRIDYRRHFHAAPPKHQKPSFSKNIPHAPKLKKVPIFLAKVTKPCSIIVAGSNPNGSDYSSKQSPGQIENGRTATGSSTEVGALYIRAGSAHIVPPRKNSNHQTPYCNLQSRNPKQKENSERVGEIDMENLVCLSSLPVRYHPANQHISTEEKMSGVAGRTVGRYELGKTLGEGTFAKVKFARNVETGESVAIKILDKEKVLRHRMISQIKREISTMKLIKHPNVIQMFEVMASKTKIYIVLELVTGGELFDKVAGHGRMREDEARKYFQQLIDAVDYCHSRGVFHRDLKPENLLLNSSGTLKVSDFGLSALPQQVREDGLLHTTCGTPNYVAPEVINNKGYDGAKADLWSCGVILFVLMAGYLPFEESNLMILYRKISKAEFTFPLWFSSSAKKLIKRILDPNPSTRITISEVIANEWFKKGYRPASYVTLEDTNLDDVHAIFVESGEPINLVEERREEKPKVMNAFQLISTSQGLNLRTLFEKQMGIVKRETRFTSKCPASEIIAKIELAATPLGFDVRKNNHKIWVVKVPDVIL